MNFLLCCAIFLAAESDFSSKQKQELLQARKNIDTICELSFNLNSFDYKIHLLLSEQFDEVDKISFGFIKSYKELREIVDIKDPNIPSEYSKPQDLININIFWIIGSFLVGLAAIFLIYHYLKMLIGMIPDQFWEATIWLSIIALPWIATLLSPYWQLFILLPACFGFLGAVFLTYRMHGKDQVIEIPLFALLTIWSTLAVFFLNHIVGFMSVLSCLVFLKFVFDRMPFWIYLNITKDESVPKFILASALVLIVQFFFDIVGISIPFMSPFCEGMRYGGSLFYFIGLLIVSNKYYWFVEEERRTAELQFDWSSYGVMQVTFLCSVLVCVYLGSIFDMGYLTAVSGTVLCVYLLDKYFEIPWEGVGFSWSLLGLGVILYFIGMLSKNYPQYFISFQLYF